MDAKSWVFNGDDVISFRFGVAVLIHQRKRDLIPRIQLRRELRQTGHCIRLEDCKLGEDYSPIFASSDRDVRSCSRNDKNRPEA